MRTAQTGACTFSGQQDWLTVASMTASRPLPAAHACMHVTHACHMIQVYNLLMLTLQPVVVVVCRCAHYFAIKQAVCQHQAPGHVCLCRNTSSAICKVTVFPSCMHAYHLWSPGTNCSLAKEATPPPPPDHKVQNQLVLQPAYIASCMQISLARACGGAYVTALCLLTALGVAFFSILRTKSDPGSGLLTTLGYTITILVGEFSWPARVMWRQVTSAA